MRYFEIAERSAEQQRRMNTATVHVLDQEWSELAEIRRAHGPNRIIAVRPLAPRFEGFSVDVLCRDPGTAVDLVAHWVVSGRRSTRV